MTTERDRIEDVLVVERVGQTPEVRAAFRDLAEAIRQSDKASADHQHTAELSEEYAEDTLLSVVRGFVLRAERDRLAALTPDATITDAVSRLCEAEYGLDPKDIPNEAGRFAGFARTVLSGQAEQLTALREKCERYRLMVEGPITSYVHAAERLLARVREAIIPRSSLFPASIDSRSPVGDAALDLHDLSFRQDVLTALPKARS